MTRAEELIAEMKGLLGVDDLPQRFDKVKEVQQAWKKMGRLPRERNDELWRDL